MKRKARRGDRGQEKEGRGIKFFENKTTQNQAM